VWWLKIPTALPHSKMIWPQTRKCPFDPEVP
jgi:hypothetical protein